LSPRDKEGKKNHQRSNGRIGGTRQNSREKLEFRVDQRRGVVLGIRKDGPGCARKGDGMGGCVASSHVTNVRFEGKTAR